VDGQGTAFSARRAARVAQLVERILGKDEVRGSIPRASLVVEQSGAGSQESGALFSADATPDS
jgi:hypothetical protein